MDTPVVFSFCISSRGRMSQIGRLLKSISDVGVVLHDDYEVVVVDQNPLSPLASQVEPFGRLMPALQYIARPDDVGVAKGRNCAVRASKGLWLICIDDDAQLTPGYAQALESIRLTARSGGVFLGRTIDPNQHWTGKRLPLTVKQVTPATAWTYSGFPVFRRDCLDHIGGFDERLGMGTYFGGDEDTDYAIRSLVADIPVTYMPQLACVHVAEVPGPNKVLGMARARGGLFHKYRHTAVEGMLSKALGSYVRDLKIKRSVQRVLGPEVKFTQKNVILTGIAEGYREWGNRYVE